ncbi:hypothetical protein M752DRAFT_133708 [Aspergillus phoenicis ATCC 13157]|uniref:Uncharacterized protein n=1 Tax=Aspergillus phoenicis ATCC 13157 TaxID=1353007 RepID=A0A370PST6_ASPPH|nr:hypothetical protein M752DRAFT_133708 [Aspergillus phoenicis ATCC 13157]
MRYPIFRLHGLYLDSFRSSSSKLLCLTFLILSTSCHTMGGLIWGVVPRGGDPVCCCSIYVLSVHTTSKAIRNDAGYQ